MLSGKISSIFFLLITILLALFLGSYNFLIINTNAKLPNIQMPDNLSNGLIQNIHIPPSMK
jgi:hypothetical protein